MPAYGGLKSFFLLAVVYILASCTNNAPENNSGITTIIPNKSDSFNAPSLIPVDKSPMDMSYYPPDYPMEKMAGNDSLDPVARIIYSRPQQQGRIIFGDSALAVQNPNKVIQQYGKPWRLGANEATEIEFYKPVTIAGRKFAKGEYILYCIPEKDQWKIVFNTNLLSWGLHIDSKKDIFSTSIPITTDNPSTEFFTMLFEKAPAGCNLVMAWGRVKAKLPISFQE